MKRTWEVDPKWADSKKGRRDATRDFLEMGVQSLEDAFNTIDKIIGLSSNWNKSKEKCRCDCMDPMIDCYPCGPLRSDTDIKLETRLGELRVLSILVENNRNVPQEVKLDVKTIFDACGNMLENKREVIRFAPDSITIPACDCQRAMIVVHVRPPFDDGQVYYAEIMVSGDCFDEIVSLGIWVQPDHYIDHFVLTDPCRPKKGKFVEFRNCNCDCCSEGKLYYVCQGEDRWPIKERLES